MSERMPKRGSTNPEPVASATLLLLRDRPRGLEVLMLERHARTEFVPGAMVFPGGKIEPEDAHPALRERCTAADGLSDEDVSLRVAAIREAFEECRVLLARRRGDPGLLGGADLAGIESRHWRDLNAGRVTWRAIVEGENLELALDRLVPFAHWITPEWQPRRYDTVFFLAEAPPDQVALHDGHEAVDSLWTTPARAVAEGADGRRFMIMPTVQNLLKLGRCDSCAEALAAARASRIVTVLPRVENRASGAVVRIPAEADYDLVEAPVDGDVG